jgi:serine beta-lactamase-like protein LACTB
MPVSRRVLLTGSAGLAAIAAAPASAGTTASLPRIAQARQVVKAILAADAIPALSIAVMKGDELLWSEAFGSVDLELDVAATPQHRFRLGSVSKAVTATLAARLAVNGSVDLDAPIGKYLPDLPMAHRETTLTQLLTHRGGVRHYIDRDSARDAPGGPIDQRNYLNNAEVLAVFINDPLVARPGEAVIYSTFGYTLASVVLETATGTAFPELVQREIGAPLGLASFGVDAPRSIVRNRVSGYVPLAHALPLRPKIETPWANAPMNNPAYKWPGGGLMATPADLATFGAAHLPRGKLSREVRDLLFTVRTEATDRSPPLGLGWRIDRDASQRLRLHHAGGQDGARASLVVYPQEAVSIAFATNITGAPGDVNGPSAKIADAFIDG